MPGESFYQGLLLPEAIRKMAEHHAAPQTRHLSFYEYQLLLSLATRLDRSPDSQRITDDEASSNWQSLAQVYSTLVSARDSAVSLEVGSIPTRVVQDDGEQDDDWFAANGTNIGLSAFEIEHTRPALRVPATIVATEATIASLLAAQAGEGTAPEWFAEFNEHPSVIQQALTELDLGLLNRVLYQPSVAVEQSPPAFESLQGLITAAGSAYVGLVQLPHSAPYAILEVGGMIIVVKVASALGDKLSDLIDRVGQSSGRPPRKRRKR